MINLVKRQLKRAFRPTLALACDNLALSLLRNFEFDYLPWTAAAIRPAALCAVLNEVIINRRKCLVEFGAGISTLYVAKQLKECGGRMFSFEHDRDWHGIIQRQLEKHQLDHVASLIHAPLAPCEFSLESCKWYDCKVVHKALDGVQVDGILVDGPPASSRGLGLARYPAVPILQKYLAENYFIYLDDIDRKGESEIFRRWQSLLNLEGTKELVAGKYGLLRKGSKFAVAVAAF